VQLTRQIGNSRKCANPLISPPFYGGGLGAR
jgi:hypothetical protein